MTTERFAPDGAVWVCHACGKTTKDLYGDERGWDESCMLNAVLCHEEKGFTRGGMISWKPFKEQAHDD